jgi:hypothetical protein
VLFVAFNGFSHKYYVAIANMEYNEKDQQIDVFLKATAHDFQHLMEMTFKERMDLDTVSQNKKYSSFIESYLKENFIVTSLDQPASFEYIGMEVTERLNIFFYFSFKEVLNPKKIKIASKFLFDFFKDQQNIVHYKYGEQTKSVTLVPALSVAEIKFD